MQRRSRGLRELCRLLGHSSQAYYQYRKAETKRVLEEDLVIQQVLYHPEDYQHIVGDPPTDLKLHPNSPGYRLILNNVLFPAARKKKQKT